MDPSVLMSNPFVDRRDSYAPSYPSSMSMRGSFDASFGSDMSSTFSTPAAQDLDNPFEYHDWSSAASQRSTTPPEPYMATMTHNVLGFHEHAMMFSTPTKPSLGPSMIAYDFPYVNDEYSSLGQDFMGTPGLAFDIGSSPMGDIHTPSPLSRQRQFVVPSQTFLDAFEPSTPVHSIGHASSPNSSSYPSNGLLYFISPVQTKHEHQSSSPMPQYHAARSSVCSTPTRAMESSHILHRATNSSRVRKSSEKANIVSFVPEGKYKCTHPGCKSEHAFKRQEHLKRHMKTHVAQKDLVCSYCPKKFQQDRSDNYRSHVKLHSKRDSKGSRTKYFPEAEAEVESWKKDRSRSGNVKLESDSMHDMAEHYAELDY